MGDSTAGESPAPSPLPVLEHWLVAYRRTWRGSVLTTFLLPVLLLVGMGVSVGSYVNRGGLLGVPYLDYIAPGLLAASALQLGINESTWPILGGFEWRRTFFAMQASPLRAQDLVGGHALYVALRVLAASVGFLVAMLLLGAAHSWWTVLTLPVAVLVGLAAALPVTAFSATITSDNLFSLIYRFGVVPMTLFAGVFFPVAMMPAPARWLAYASPLWHGVELCRAATLGVPPAAGVWLHVGYLVSWAAVGYGLARSRFVRRLAK
jgi:lipooligosaccharide transport system permease protein